MTELKFTDIDEGTDVIDHVFQRRANEYALNVQPLIEHRRAMFQDRRMLAEKILTMKDGKEKDIFKKEEWDCRQEIKKVMAEIDRVRDNIK